MSPRQEWESAQWQRAHCVKNVRQLRQVMGDLLGEDFYADLERDQRERATMSMLLPPQMLNTMVPTGTRRAYTAAFYADPVRRYMLPVTQRPAAPTGPRHPQATRDSLHEQEMWAVEGLTHRYPTKVLAEILPTCPQYCGHCTRMDLVGNSTPQVDKHKFSLQPPDRLEQMLDYLRPHPGRTRRRRLRRGRGQHALAAAGAFRRPAAGHRHVRDIRLATKAPDGPPPALAAGRGPAPAWSGWPTKARAARGAAWRSTPTSTPPSR